MKATLCKFWTDYDKPWLRKTKIYTDQKVMEREVSEWNSQDCTYVTSELVDMN